LWLRADVMRKVQIMTEVTEFHLDQFI